MSEKKILIVDDDSSMRRLLTYHLEKAGYEVLDAEDGEDGLAKAESEKPDVVITDLMMANKDGFELCRDIRSRRDLDSVSIVVITARDSSSDVGTLMAAGANAVMQKPFNPQELTRTLQDIISKK